MKIKDETWDIFKDYLIHTIDYFESYEKLDYEQCTLKNQLYEILTYHYESDIAQDDD